MQVPGPPCTVELELKRPLGSILEIQEKYRKNINVNNNKNCKNDDNSNKKTSTKPKEKKKRRKKLTGQVDRGPVYRNGCRSFAVYNSNLYSKG